MKVELEKVVFEGEEEKLTCDHLDQSRCIVKDHVTNITNVCSECVCLDKEIVQERRHLELWQVGQLPQKLHRQMWLYPGPGYPLALGYLCLKLVNRSTMIL